MRGVNVILIYNCGGDKILMCKREREPFKGLHNLIGGKIEPGEDGLAAAYREMYEESSITSGNIRLYHLMDFTYYDTETCLEVYAGKLKRDVEVSGEENELCWIDADSNFFDNDIFAGLGNIGHMVEQAKLGAETIFRD